MKLAIVPFFLLCFHFVTPNGVCNDSYVPLCSVSAKGTASLLQDMDEFPKDIFTFNCPLPDVVESFRMKLFKGQSEICVLYIDNDVKRVTCNEFCDPVHSNDSISFVLRNLNSRHSDTYTCCLEVLVPVYAHCKISEKHLYIQGTEESCLLSDLTSKILVGLTVFSVGFSIFLLIVCSFRAMVCRHDPSSRDYNNEYMAMAAVKFG
nr:inducible T-cell costimulator [Pogona vitticeps]